MKLDVSMINIEDLPVKTGDLCYIQYNYRIGCDFPTTYKVIDIYTDDLFEEKHPEQKGKSHWGINYRKKRLKADKIWLFDLENIDDIRRNIYGFDPYERNLLTLDELVDLYKKAAEINNNNILKLKETIDHVCAKSHKLMHVK